MRILGRELVAPFDAFWATFSGEFPGVEALVAEGHSTVFGDQGADLTSPHPPDWLALPDAELAYHVAHELTHIAMTSLGYPKTLRGARYSDDSAEAKIGGDMEEMVIHPALQHLLAPFGFERGFILERMASGALSGLRSSPVPERGSPWSFTWAMRYCELQIELPAHLWSPIETIYQERAPGISRLGQELIEVMREVGWSTRQETLETLIRCRDTLGMRVDDRVLVLDPTTDALH